MIVKGLGTLINAVAIIAAGILGVTCKRFIKESYQDTMIKAAGLAVMFMGAAGSLSKMIVIDGKTLSTTGTINIVISLAIGGLIGEIIDIDGLFNRFGAWLKHKSGNDGG